MNEPGVKYGIIGESLMVTVMPCLPDNPPNSYREFIPPLIVNASIVLYVITERGIEPERRYEDDDDEKK